MMRLLREAVEVARRLSAERPAMSGAPFLSCMEGALVRLGSVERNGMLDTTRCPLLLVNAEHVVVVTAEVAGTRESLRRSLDDYYEAGADAVLCCCSRRRLMVGYVPYIHTMSVRMLLVGPEACHA